jgi:hypothetical protein
LAIAGGEDPQNELNDLKEVSLDYLWNFRNNL